jgi:hypothetical protein
MHFKRTTKIRTTKMPERKSPLKILPPPHPQSMDKKTSDLGAPSSGVKLKLNLSGLSGPKRPSAPTTPAPETPGSGLKIKFKFGGGGGL